MAAPTKTLSVALLAPVSVANAAQSAGTAVDVSGAHLLGATLWLGRADGTAHASPWAQLVIEGNPSATDDSLWSPIASLVMPAGASIANTTLNGAVSADATTFVVTSATNIAAGAFLFVGDDDAAEWEIVRVQSISSTTVTVNGACEFAHNTGAVVTSQAEIVTIPSLDIAGLARVRGRCLNNSGRTVYARILGVTTVL